mmetsp:Transcript_37659/g.61304  ORF Transcript_37659/g.61304 Transcript_37659/m.61304 type:complete len:225 (+) Transcript_37659:175-849(+)
MLEKGEISIACSSELLCELERLIGCGASADERALLETAVDKKECDAKTMEVVVKLRAGSNVPLIDLVKASGGLQFPKLAVPKVDPALEERRRWLIARQQQREYLTSVKSVTGFNEKKGQQQQTISEIRKLLKELSVGFALILVCAGAFLACKLSCDQLGLEPATGWIAGLCGGAIMLFIEMILFVIRTTREETYERMKKSRGVGDNNISHLPSKRAAKPLRKKL